MELKAVSENIYVDLVSHLGGHVKASKALGVEQGTVSGWTRGAHGMSAHVAMRAESVTGGKFKASDLHEKLKEFNDPAA